MCPFKVPWQTMFLFNCHLSCCWINNQDPTPHWSLVKCLCFYILPVQYRKYIMLGQEWFQTRIKSSCCGMPLSFHLDAVSIKVARTNIFTISPCCLYTRSFWNKFHSRYQDGRWKLCVPHFSVLLSNSLGFSRSSAQWNVCVNTDPCQHGPNNSLWYMHLAQQHTNSIVCWIFCQKSHPSYEVTNSDVNGLRRVWLLICPHYWNRASPFMIWEYSQEAPSSSSTVNPGAQIFAPLSLSLF